MATIGIAEEPRFFTSTFAVRVNLPARYLGPELSQNLENFLKERYENSCYQESYLRRNSIRLLRRTLGQTFGSHFNGDMTMWAIIEAQCFKPLNGSIIKAQVIGKNAIGLQTSLYPAEIPMEILITRNQNSERLGLLNQIAIDQIIAVKVLRYEFHGNKINAVGLLYDVLAEDDLRTQRRWALVARPVPLALDERLLEPLLGAADSATQEWWERSPEQPLNSERVQRLQQWQKAAWDGEIKADIVQGATNTWWLFPDLDHTVVTPALPCPWSDWLQRRSVFTFQPPALSAHYFPLLEIFKTYPGEFFSPLDRQRRFLVLESRPIPGARDLEDEQDLAPFGGSLQALLTTRLASGAVDFQDQVTSLALQVPTASAATLWEPFQQRDWQQRTARGGIDIHTGVLPTLSAGALRQAAEETGSGDKSKANVIIFDCAESLLSATSTPVLSAGAMSPSVTISYLFYFLMLQQQLEGHLLWNLGSLGVVMGSSFLVSLVTLLCTLYRSVDFYRPQFGGSDGNVWLIARNYHGLRRDSPTATNVDDDDRQLWAEGLRKLEERLAAVGGTNAVVQQLFSSELLLRSELWTVIGRAMQALLEQTLSHWETIADYSSGRRLLDSVELASQQRITLLAWAERYFPPLRDEQNLVTPQYHL